MSKREIIDSRALNIALNRLCCKLIENHGDCSSSILIGMQPRGVQVLERIVKLLESTYGVQGVRTGVLDITFYRDDFRRRPGHLQPNKTRIDHLVEDQTGYSTRVNSRHHQHCETLAANFTITHTGGNIIEGIEDLDRQIWAVQWHPERMESDDNLYPLDKLFAK